MHKRNQAFTIVELLIVIVIIAILAAVSIVAYGGMQRRANSTIMQSDLQNAATQLELDKAVKGVYPATKETADDNKGLPSSNGVTYQYTGTDTTYCLTAISDKKGMPTYIISNDNRSPRDGICSGHYIPVNNEGVVATLAGSSTSGFVDGMGIAAQFRGVWAIEVGPSGDIYVIDRNNHAVRKITPSGAVTTLAGSGALGYADGTGVAAQFNYPVDLTVDGSGVVYVADTNNNRIRKVTPEGVVTTFAGSGAPGSVNGTGTAATFNGPRGIAVDSSGTLYVSDSYNNRIRKITSAGVVTTFVGGGNTINSNNINNSINSPEGLDLDSAGNLYVADNGSHRIRKITPSGVMTTVAGGGMSASGSVDGTGTDARFYLPRDIVVDGSSTIYVADMGNSLIRKITREGVVTTLAGSTHGYLDGIGTGARLNYLRGIAISPAGVLYIADTNNGRVRTVQ